MLAAFLAFLQVIPGVASVINGLGGKYFDAKVAITRAKLGVDRDKAIAILQGVGLEQHEATARLSVIAGNRMLTLMVVGFATPLILFVWKVVVVDIVIGPGCFHVWWTGWGGCWVGDTDPIKGQVADWANTIIISLFGAGTAATVAKMWFSKDKPNAP